MLICTGALAQEVTRGMRAAASRGFWVTSYAPYGYRRVYVQDGAKKRPKLELDPPADAVVRRIFDMVLQGKSILDVTKTLNAEGIPTTNGKKWLKTTIHTMLDNEVYTGALVWGTNAKDGVPPVRVEDAFPAIVTKREFRQAKRLLGSRAPKKMNPRRASSPYLLSGLLKCETCGKARTAAEAKSGKYTYYVCHSLLKLGSGTCKTPRLNAKTFEKLIVDDYSVYTMRQASRRSWRIGQTRPVKVVFRAYRKSLQADALKLVAKLQSSLAVEGSCRRTGWRPMATMGTT